MAIFERPDHRRLIYHLSSCGVHDDRTLLQLSDHLFPDEALCLLSQGYVYAQHIREAQKLVKPVRAKVFTPLRRVRDART